MFTPNSPLRKQIIQVNCPLIHLKSNQFRKAEIVESHLKCSAWHMLISIIMSIKYFGGQWVNITLSSRWMMYEWILHYPHAGWCLLYYGTFCTSIVLEFNFVIVFSTHFSIARSVTPLNKQEILIFDDLLSIISIFDYIKRIDKKNG